MDNNKSNLEVSKQFQCSKEVLFKAWTEQDQLKQWWKPLGKQLTNVTNDLKEGGTVKYEFEDNALTIDGQYEKVSGNDQLEYTWNWHLTAEPVEDANYKLSVRFSGEGSNSNLTVTQSGFNNEERIQPHKHGWEQALDQLSQYVGKQGGSASSLEPSEQKPPITGYMETPEQQKVGGG